MKVPRPYQANRIINLQVSLDQPNDTGRTIYVRYSTVDGSAVGGTATATGTDYVTVTNGLVSFTANQQVKTIPITIRPGLETDPDEFFTVQLFLTANSGEVHLGTPIGVVGIVHPVPFYLPVTLHK